MTLVRWARKACVGIPGRPAHKAIVAPQGQKVILVQWVQPAPKESVATPANAGRWESRGPKGNRESKVKPGRKAPEAQSAAPVHKASKVLKGSEATKGRSGLQGPLHP